MKENIPSLFPFYDTDPEDPERIDFVLGMADPESDVEARRFERLMLDAQHLADLLAVGSGVPQKEQYVERLRRQSATLLASLNNARETLPEQHKAIAYVLLMAVQLGRDIECARADAVYAKPAHVGIRVMDQVGGSKHPGNAELAQLLQACGGNKSEVARRLGVSVRSVGRWINGK
jgi:hypothetical protein